MCAPLCVQVQTPVALVDRNLDRRSSKMRGPTLAAAQAFVQYLFTPEAQAEFADSGFRCGEQKHMLYREPPQLLARSYLSEHWIHAKKV